MSARRGFTIVELMIVLTIVFILVGIAYPIMNGVEEQAETTAMAMTVRRVRQQIWYHATVGDTPLSGGGYPEGVRPTWFEEDTLPAHPATGEPLKLQEVSGGKSEIYPNQKSFNVNERKNSAAGHTAWYNRANGAFCLKVPREGSPEQILARFYEVNAGIEERR